MGFSEIITATKHPFSFDNHNLVLIIHLTFIIGRTFGKIIFKSIIFRI